jgi:hypothetical protein
LPHLGDVVLLAGMFRALVIRESAVSIAGSPPVPARLELLLAATKNLVAANLETTRPPNRISQWPLTTAQGRDLTGWLS